MKKDDGPAQGPPDPGAVLAEVLRLVDNGELEASAGEHAFIAGACQALRRD